MFPVFACKLKVKMESRDLDEILGSLIFNFLEQ